jgi:signal transduction histidine kinase
VSTAAEKVNILLVDDQPARLGWYESILAGLQQNLVCAAPGPEALEQLMRGEFAVVLMDVSMADDAVLEAARLIHEHPRLEKTPIIFVTGAHATGLDRLLSHRPGAVDCVPAPAMPEILRSKVAVLVELHCKRRELQEVNRTLGNANAELASLNAALERANTALQRANADLGVANQALQNEVRERVRAEQTQNERDRLREFLGVLGHELRNPLAPIQNAVLLLHRQPVHDPQISWLGGIIARQLTHMTRLVDDLLDVQRVTRGQINLTSELVDVDSIVARAVETVQPLIDARGHQLTVEMPGETARVRGDPVRLTQALANLLSNAAKYTGNGGQIAVTGQVRDGKIELRVRDSGIGIRADQLQLIFNLFTQIEGTDQSQRGLGIGLALVRRLVEMHRGSITAHSDGPGRGSEFIIVLPLHARQGTASVLPAAVQETGATAPDVTATGITPRKILVADDNVDSLESLAMLLETAGHTVYTAVDGRQTLECAERHLPEVILLDIGMPLIDGYEVARRIRAQPWGQGITLVALTGWGRESDRQLSREAGFDSHLVKPVGLDGLTRAVAHGRLRSAAAIKGA